MSMQSRFPNSPGPIGVFDSGYGGLTILREMRKLLPEYDYLYLGDNARAPYGSRSFDVVYDFTLDAVKALFSAGCHLVILACNTASAKALRTIQQNDLEALDPDRRVLGVIRPTVESLASSPGGHIGVLATYGTTSSRSYSLEVAKLFPEMTVTEQACPMWVPLIENRESDGEGADYFVKKYLQILFSRDPQIDTIVLGCTHYPLLLKKILRYVPKNISIVAQGELVARSLRSYLLRHTAMDEVCAKHGRCRYLTTESTAKFDRMASLFMGENVESTRISL